MNQRRSPSILLIRPDHLGDVLLTLPAVAALRRALPAARLAYAVPPAVASVPRHCPHLDETLTFPFPRREDADAKSPAWRETVGTEATRISGAFDAALVVRPDDPWSGELVAAARIPIRLGFDMPRTRPFLTEALPVPRDQHVSADAFDLAEALLARLGVRRELTRVADSSFVVSDEEEREAAELAAAAGEAHPIVLHPGSGWPLKNWPAERWRRVASDIARRFGSRAIVAGSAGERALVEDVVDGTPAIGLAGQLSLGGLAALHRRARLVVATDGGAMHLAALMGAPVVGIFGPASPALFAPLCPPERHRVVRAGLACSPCGTLEHPPCGAFVAPDCITAIAVGAVLRAAVDLLGARA